MNQKELDNDLKQDCRAYREIDDLSQAPAVTKIMKLIENERKRLMKEKSKKYTQEWLAEKANIKLITYRRYVYGWSTHIKLVTVLNIAHALDIDCSPLFNLFHSPYDE